MPDTPVPPPPPASSPAANPPEPESDFNIGEEYGTARKNLPPAGILAVCVGIVVIIAGTYALTHRAHPLSRGTVDDVVAVPVPGQQMVMVAVNISIQNNEDNPTVIQAIRVSADMNGNKVTDDASPAVDAQRYFESMPELKQHALQLISTETRVPPGGHVSGTVVVSFPVSPEAFAARKSLTVTVSPYNELPIVMTK
jgi:hypothetical protein